MTHIVLFASLELFWLIRTSVDNVIKQTLLRVEPTHLIHCPPTPFSCINEQCLQLLNGSQLIWILLFEPALLRVGTIDGGKLIRILLFELFVLLVEPVDGSIHTSKRSSLALIMLLKFTDCTLECRDLRLQPPVRMLCRSRS